jgi:16S rRNA (guanine1207-N2)-methyltransferase
MTLDAADSYLLRHLADADLSGEVVVLGDREGDLLAELAGSGTAGRRPALITDSFTALEKARTKVGEDRARLLSTQDEPPERIDVLLVRVPKSLALLEDQLHRLAPRLHPGSLVVGAGKVTEIHTSTLALFERLVGPTRTSLAERKARLIFSEPTSGGERPANPWPLSYPLPVDKALGAVSGLPVANHAGIFCAERLDIGTRFLLEHLPATHGAVDVVDLGCGNGILGLAAALGNPRARLTLVDESFQAVASAHDTFAANLPPERVEATRFQAGDALGAVPDASIDLVLNNPPFHSHRATTDETAWHMFTGARRVLRPGGELWVVANRHLGYHGKLRRVFGNCDTVAGNPKFVILRAVRSQR